MKGLEFDIARSVVHVGVRERLPGPQRVHFGEGWLPRRGGVGDSNNLEEAGLDYSKCRPREARK